MPLEATMMLIDNSEFMRNGDYLPTRYDAQKDAITTVFQSKVDSNPENTVGVMTMAGKSPEVLVTHTKEIGQILSSLHRTSSNIGGSADVITAISVAQLALKHRTNKTLRQRIIVFVGSPLPASADEKALTRLAKKLKKNNVAVDVVSFGEDETREPNEVVLRQFVEGVSSGENSHFLSVPPGSRLLSDALQSSPILAGEGAAADVDAFGTGPGPSGGGGEFEFGVDPSMDPELAMALRLSMEEARAREAPAAPAAAAAASSTLASVPEVTMVSGPTGDLIPGAETEDEEERLLAQAIALSTQQAEDVEMGDVNMDDDDLSEEEQIARAIQMSMEADEEEEANPATKKS